MGFEIPFEGGPVSSLLVSRRRLVRDFAVDPSSADERVESALSIRLNDKTRLWFYWSKTNPTNQLLAELLLQELGHRVHTVANGQEAIEALTRITYD